MRWLVIAVILAGTAPAHADKSRATAVELSATGAAMSTAFVFGAFFTGRDNSEVNEPLLYTGLGTSVITPSLGEIYAGQYLSWGMGIRAGAGALAGIALSLHKETVTCELATSSNQTCTQLSGTAVAVLGLAAIAYVGGVALDVMDAGPAADRYNAVHGKTYAYALVPTVLPTPTGAVPGVYFSATY
ncbi:MAG TPA: hypothetical protein VMJ10_14295 [Kofleriaceae bacterium]|nr:hypothetical protein [Kofleriaceae bacterium]